MSKITFRADDDLVAAVEDLDASKSEVMRDALRAYLDGEASSDAADTLDAVVAERVDELVADRLGDPRGSRRPPARDVNVTITVESAPGTRVSAGQARAEERERDADRGRAGGPRGGERGGGRGEQSCAQCGESVSPDHVYCPNCGEKASRRVFCECGDEVRADWAFCPHCGRRTASADALDGGR
jgi:RNA polymerase subunit RPABC4/transcription elongation factor Spt4